MTLCIKISTISIVVRNGNRLFSDKAGGGITISTENRTCQALAPAKINLGLDVLRKREDGYHDLRMIMQSISVYDRLTFTWSEHPGVTGTCSREGLPMDEHNLVIRAARLLQEEFRIPGGLRIHLDKQIPMAAGLAGGSSDAAATLISLNKLWSLGLTRTELMQRGVRLGADIPFCIMGGTALAEGIGDRLTALPPAPESFVLLAKPPLEVSTAFVYGNLQASKLREHPRIDAQVEAIRQGDHAAMCALCGNVLERVTIPAYPVIEEIKGEMLREGAQAAMMSGSGPTVFGLFRDEEASAAAAEAMWERFGYEEILTARFARGVCCTLGESFKETELRTD